MHFFIAGQAALASLVSPTDHVLGVYAPRWSYRGRQSEPCIFPLFIKARHLIRSSKLRDRTTSRTLNLLRALPSCSGERTKTQGQGPAETGPCVAPHSFLPVSLDQPYKDKRDDDLQSVLM